MTRPATYGDVEGFVTMLLAVCEDANMKQSLEILLTQPDTVRRAAVHEFLERFRAGGAPKALCEAFACLLDDDVAERVYVHIYACPRSEAG